jgi:hypothetical protein
VTEIDSTARSRRTLWIGVAGAAVIAAAATTYLLVSDGGSHTVKFEVSSSGEKVSSIVYGAGGSQLGKDVGTAATVPWTKSAELTDTSGNLWLHALAPAGGAITCTIWVDNRVVTESTGLSGVKCEIPFDEALG